MKISLVLIVVAALVAVSCKDSVMDTNPQEDNSEQSTLFAPGTPLSVVQPTDLDEASGLVHARSNTDYVWTHNDSGGEAMMFLLHLNGADSGRYTLSGITNVDWEDVALGAGPDDNINYLYAGDIGDNRAQRSSYSIHRFPEPDLTLRDLPATESIDDFQTIEFIYEDGARDAETLMVDPTTRDLFIVSKREASNILYKLPFPQDTVALDTAVRVRVLPFTFSTAGDISQDGNEVLIKNYLNVYYWRKQGAESIEELLQNPPTRLNYTQEPQGEAIAFRVDGTSYLTISEIANASEVELLNYNRN